MNFFSTLLRRASICDPIQIVFFPGTGCSGSIFQKIEQQFSAQSVKFYYMQTKGNCLHTISKNSTDELRKLLKNHKTIAVAHSLGGINAALTVAAAPELFQGLVLCNTKHKQQLTELEREKKTRLLQVISRRTDEQFNKSLCSAFFKDQEAFLTEEEVQLLIKELTFTGKQTYIQQLQLSLEDVEPDYKKILTYLPITVIQGSNDRIMPAPGWEEANLQEYAPKYSLFKCSGGHLSILKHPELIASQINQMIIDENNLQSTVAKPSSFQS